MSRAWVSTCASARAALERFVGASDDEGPLRDAAELHLKWLGSVVRAFVRHVESHPGVKELDDIASYARHKLPVADLAELHEARALAAARKVQRRRARKLAREGA